jgi:hypothetical protein
MVVGGASSQRSESFRSARSRLLRPRCDRLACDVDSAELAANAPLQLTNAPTIIN